MLWLFALAEAGFLHFGHSEGAAGYQYPHGCRGVLVFYHKLDRPAREALVLSFYTMRPIHCLGLGARPMFDLQGAYYKTAYTFLAAGKMLSTPHRVELSGSDTVGLAALAGRSSDGKTVQILISNYEIPVNNHPRDMQPPRGALPKNTAVTDFPKVKSLPPRTDIQYKNNRGFHLTVEGLPWGKAQPTRDDIPANKAQQVPENGQEEQHEYSGYYWRSD
jgi:hypothetical protein